MTPRIQAIAKAAASLFLKQGYSKTQISHIAKEVGVSVGTIYHDFTGKKEIMHYILKTTIDSSFSQRQLETPISDEPFIGLEQDIVKVLEDSAAEFKKPLLQDLENYTFKDLISDAFDLLARYGAGCLFIEKNQYDFPFLAKHYKAYRSEFLSTMSEYLQVFMDKGMIRRIDDIELTTILIVEILSWWAMDMRWTSFETLDVPEEAAKKVCLDNILSAYEKKSEGRSEEKQLRI